MKEHDVCEYEADRAIASSIAIIRWAVNIGIGLAFGGLGTMAVLWYRG